MNRKPDRRVLAVLLLLPLLGGCFVTSKNPVMRPGEDGRNPALRGLWVTENGREFLHVLRPELKEGQNEADEPPGFSGLYVVSEGDDPDDRDGWTGVRMIATDVKDRGILSMRFKEGESGGDLEDMPGWLIFAYEVTKEGRLYLRMIDEDIINAAIEAGELPGTPKSGQYGDPHVNATGEEWIAYLEGADLNEMFADEDSFLTRLSTETIEGFVKKPEAGAEPAAGTPEP